MRKLNLIGQKFGMLTVLAYSEKSGKDVGYDCKCDCGNIKTNVLTYNLTTGKSKSCGCVRGAKLSKNFTTHGESKTRLYGLYKGIKQRCKNKNIPAYKYYGGKGVEICKEWDNNFESFKAWAYDNGYNDSLTIDRIDPNKNYEPNNCRWVSIEKQQNNKLNNFYIDINDEKMTLAELAKSKKLNSSTLYSKFYRLFESLGILNGVKELKIKTKEPEIL